MYSPSRYWSSLLYIHRPIQLTLFLTRRCNAKCPFCFYLNNKQATDVKTSTEDRQELSLQEIEMTSNSLGPLLWLAFSGGEIFLRKDLVEISQVFYDNNKPVFMLFPTNGLNPVRIKRCMEKILKYCRYSDIIVKLSIDDLFEKQDRLRNTPGHFRKTMRSYELLTELTQQYGNLKLGVNTVFCSENQDHMQSIIDFVSTLNCINTHTISLVRGNLRHPEYKKVDLNKYRYYTNLLANKIHASQTYQRKTVAGGRLKVAQDILQRKLIFQTLREKKRIIPCYAGRANLVLTEHGELYPCETFENSFGNIRDFNYNIKTVLKSARAKSVSNILKQGNCYCSHECYFITNIMLNPRMYPELINEYLKLKVA